MRLFMSVVYHNVSFEVAGMRRLVPARITLEWFYIGVLCEKMVLEIVRPRASVIALRTLIRLVFFLMLAQMIF